MIFNCNSGRVLAIGGLTEKLEVAKHHGIKTVICPLSNLKEYQAELKGEWLTTRAFQNGQQLDRA